MSFALTTEQVRQQTKTVTRRIGWERLKPGTLLQPIVKGQGLKKGERVEKIGGPIRVISVRQELLMRMTTDVDYGFAETTREGFPVGHDKHWPSLFIEMFCNSHRVIVSLPNPVWHQRGETRSVRPDDTVTRIEFEYTQAPSSTGLSPADGRRLLPADDPNAPGAGEPDHDLSSTPGVRS